MLTAEYGLPISSAAINCRDFLNAEADCVAIASMRWRLHFSASMSSSSNCSSSVQLRLQNTAKLLNPDSLTQTGTNFGGWSKVTRHSQYVIFQLAEVSGTRKLFAAIIDRMDRLALLPPDINGRMLVQESPRGSKTLASGVKVCAQRIRSPARSLKGRESDERNPETGARGKKYEKIPMR